VVYHERAGNLLQKKDGVQLRTAGVIDSNEKLDSGGRKKSPKVPLQNEGGKRGKPQPIHTGGKKDFFRERPEDIRKSSKLS